MAAMAFGGAKSHLAHPDRWVAGAQMQHQGGLLRELGIAGDDDMGFAVGLLESLLLGERTERCRAADLELPLTLPLLQLGLAPIGNGPRGGRHRRNYR